MDQLQPGTSFEFAFELAPPWVHGVRLDTKLSRRVVHLSMHLSDLRFAKGCLEQLWNFPDHRSVVAESLWRSAIVTYMKCFSPPKHGGRSQLDATKTVPPEMREAHELFTDIRNKQVAHDEGTRTFGWAYALVPALGYKPHVGPVMVPHVETGTIGPSNIAKLDALINRAAAWAHAELETVTSKIQKGIAGQYTHDELLRTPLIVDTPAQDQPGE